MRLRSSKDLSLEYFQLRYWNRQDVWSVLFLPSDHRPKAHLKKYSTVVYFVFESYLWLEHMYTYKLNGTSTVNDTTKVLALLSMGLDGKCSRPHLMKSCSLYLYTKWFKTLTLAPFTILCTTILHEWRDGFDRSGWQSWNPSQSVCNLKSLIVSITKSVGFVVG